MIYYKGIEWLKRRIQSLRHHASAPSNWYLISETHTKIDLTQDLPLLLIRVLKRHLILSIFNHLRLLQGVPTFLQ